MNVENPAEIYLKLENLQPIGSFKIRGASNAIRTLDHEKIKNGVWTLSAGNHGQGLAWNAQRLGVKCSVIVPDSTAKTKIEAMEKMGTKVIPVPIPRDPEKLKRVRDPQTYTDMKGLYIAPANNYAVMTGQGTIGLEIMEDLPDVDTVLTLFGGGGLSCGVASAIKALKPNVKIYGCTAETGTALAESFTRGEQVDTQRTPSFVAGASSSVLDPQMWKLAKQLLDGAIVVTLEEICETIRLLCKHNHIIAEGAGAVPVAAALSGRAGKGKIACVVSGGNIDLKTLTQIYQGKIPRH